MKTLSSNSVTLVEIMSAIDKRKSEAMAQYKQLVKRSLVQNDKFMRTHLTPENINNEEYMEQLFLGSRSIRNKVLMLTFGKCVTRQILLGAKTFAEAKFNLPYLQYFKPENISTTISDEAHLVLLENDDSVQSKNQNIYLMTLKEALFEMFDVNVNKISEIIQQTSLLNTGPKQNSSRNLSHSSEKSLNRSSVTQNGVPEFMKNAYFANQLSQDEQLLSKSNQSQQPRQDNQYFSPRLYAQSDDEELVVASNENMNTFTITDPKNKHLSMTNLNIGAEHINNHPVIINNQETPILDVCSRNLSAVQQNVELDDDFSSTSFSGYPYPYLAKDHLENSISDDDSYFQQNLNIIETDTDINTEITHAIDIELSANDPISNVYDNEDMQTRKVTHNETHLMNGVDNVVTTKVNEANSSGHMVTETNETNTNICKQNEYENTSIICTHVDRNFMNGNNTDHFVHSSSLKEENEKQNVKNLPSQLEIGLLNDENISSSGGESFGNKSFRSKSAGSESVASINHLFGDTFNETIPSTSSYGTYLAPMLDNPANSTTVSKDPLDENQFMNRLNSLNKLIPDRSNNPRPSTTSSSKNVVHTHEKELSTVDSPQKANKRQKTPLELLEEIRNMPNPKKQCLTKPITRAINDKSVLPFR